MVAYRAIGVALLAALSASCVERRDFGRLTEGYSVAAPSAAELAVMDPGGVMVLQRYVSQVGVARGYIVALCEIPADNHEQPQEAENPCSGYNVVETRTGQVSRGLREYQAAAILAAAGVPMPNLEHTGEYFNYEWPAGRPGEFCRAHRELSATEQ